MLNVVIGTLVSHYRVIDGSTPVRACASKGNCCSSLSCTWLPDGRIVFTEHEGNTMAPKFSLHSVRVDAAGRASPAIRIWGPEEGRVSSITRSTAGDRIAFTRRFQQTDVTVAELASDKWLRSQKRLTLDQGLDRPTAWTHDSRAVLFASNRNGTYDIFRQSVDSVDPQLLANGPDEQDVPRVTADGKWVIYRVLPKGGVEDRMFRFFRAPFEGGKSELVMSTGSYASARCDWSGPCVVIETVPPNKIVYELDPLTGKGRELFSLSLESGGPARSPKGMWAYSPGPGNRIQLLDSECKFLRTVTVSGVPGFGSLDWAADSTGWFAASSDSSKLYFVDTKGRSKMIFSQLPGPVLWAVTSPDGKYLAIMTSTPPESNFWSLDNP